MSRRSSPLCRAGWAAIALVGVTMEGVGCSGLTKVAAPDISQPGVFQNASGAITRQLGALGQFYTDYGAWVAESGELTDELTNAFGPDLPDLRILPDGGPASTGSSAYPGPQTRVNALTAIGLLKQYSPTPASRIGELFAAVGSIETVMAEDMCSGVPLATIANGMPVVGAQTTTAQLYADALAQFDSAARYAADSARVLNFVAVGRARALLDVDSVVAAAQAVAGIPTGYAYQALFSATTSQQNPLAFAGFSVGVLAVSNREGINGLDFVSATDPRVPIDSSGGIGADGVTPLYVFLPYLNTLATPVPVATGIEARLIEAEAALRANDVPGWTAKLNALRADSVETGVRGLPQLTADSTTLASPTMQVDVMFRERAFWLFLTGHRQGDLRRLIRQYGRPQAQVFPVGPFKNSGQQYGTDVTYPILGDKTNPNLPECLDRNP